MLNQALDRAVTAATAPLRISELQARLDGLRAENALNAQFGAQERQSNIDRQTSLTEQTNADTAVSQQNLATLQQTEDDRIREQAAETRRQEALADAAEIAARQAVELGRANINAANALRDQRLRPPAGNAASFRDANRLQGLLNPIAAPQPVQPLPTPANAIAAANPVGATPVQSPQQIPQITTDTIANFAGGNSGLTSGVFAATIRAQAAQGLISQQQAETIIRQNTGG